MLEIGMRSAPSCQAKATCEAKSSLARVTNNRPRAFTQEIAAPKGGVQGAADGLALGVVEGDELGLGDELGEGEALSEPPQGFGARSPRAAMLWTITRAGDKTLW